MHKLLTSALALYLAAAAITVFSVRPALHMSQNEADVGQPNRIRIQYVAPENPHHRDIYEVVKSRAALEKVQEIFSPVRLPMDLTVKTIDCGISNAWYQRPILTICYEYIADIRAAAPAETSANGLTRDDTIVGQFFYVVAHEMAHALFDQLDVPLFGRPEDAADGFAAYMMLALGKKDAHRLIMGAAYGYRDYLLNARVTVPLTAFADDHGAPMQRYYNLLCLAYGADPVAFADFIEKKLLPAQRAPSCKIEYAELDFAFHKLIRPHLEPKMAAAIMQKDWVSRIDTFTSSSGHGS